MNLSMAFLKSDFQLEEIISNSSTNMPNNTQGLIKLIKEKIKNLTHSKF